MNERENTACEGLFEYLSGEGSDVQRKRFEKHLAACPACIEEAALWREVWDRLGEDVAQMEPPADMKDEVLGSIFAKPVATSEDASAATIRSFEPMTRSRTGRKWIRALAVCAIAIPFLLGWLLRDLVDSDKTPTSEAQAPATIETLFQLAANRTDGRFEDSPRAYGVACLVKSDNKDQLVVYVFGTPKTQASEAYQVWLLKDGKRTSAGTFTVGDSGIGILTMPVSQKMPAFDAVGITLEPDSHSDSPRGPKMFGSSKPKASGTT